MASVGTVSIFQEARDRIVKDIDNLIQCLGEKKDSLFREIAGLENEFKSKQEQKLCSLRKLESLKARTEEELGDNILSEIQGRVTRELQNGIDKISLEARSLSVDYSIQIDWGFRMGVVKDKIKEFRIEIVPSALHFRTALSKKANKLTRPYDCEGYMPAQYQTDEIYTEWTRADEQCVEPTWADDYD